MYFIRLPIRDLKYIVSSKAKPSICVNLAENIEY